MRAAIEAAEVVIGKIARVDVRKALDPLDRDDFLRIVAQTADALQGNARPYEVSAVARAIEAIRGVEWASLSREEMNAAIDAIRAATADIGKVVMPSISETFQTSGSSIMEGSRESAIARFGLNIETALAQRDLAAERWIRSLNTLYVSENYGARADYLSSVAREVVTNGVEQGIGSDAIAERLASTIGTRIAQPASYWQVLATAFSNTGRTFSQLGAFSDAGIQSYQFEAVLDEVTCFGAGTRVRLSNGRARKIEQVRPGDEVMSCRGIPRRVTALRVFSKRTWGNVELESGKKLRVTPNHPILTLRGWVAAGHLTTKDRIVAYERNRMSRLWDSATAEADRETEDRMRAVLPTRENAASRVQGMRGAVPTRSDVEDGDAGVLLGGMPDDDENVRILRDDVLGATALRESGAGEILLADVSSRSVQEGRVGCVARTRVRDVQGTVLGLAAGSDLGEGSSSLLEGVFASAQDHSVRGVRGRGSDEGGARSPVLLDGVLPQAFGRDEHRADGSDPTSLRGVRVRAGEEDRAVVDRLPGRRDDRARSRRGVLAREVVGTGARREARRAACGDGLSGDSSRGAGDSSGSTMRDQRLAGLWPYPVRDIDSVAKTVGIVSIGWELTAKDEPAYDIEVEEDAGYIAEGVVVHNTDQCRFYHGQTFNVGQSVAQASAIAQLDDPEAVKNANPWIRSGTDENGNRILYFTRDGERTTIATIDRSGVGARDDRGSYSGAMTSAQLAGAGIPYPPLHGNCRSTIVPVI